MIVSWFQDAITVPLRMDPYDCHDNSILILPLCDEYVRTLRNWTRAHALQRVFVSSIRDTYISSITYAVCTSSRSKAIALQCPVTCKVCRTRVLWLKGSAGREVDARPLDWTGLLLA